MYIIVLDGNQKSSLALVRSLGKRGMKVISCDEQDAKSFYSNYVSKHFQYPSPTQCPAEFSEFLTRLSHKYSPSLLLPMSDITMSQVLKSFHPPPNTLIPFSDFTTYIGLSNKLNLFRIAENMGISMPWTLFSDDYFSAKQLLGQVQDRDFPVVLKPSLSRLQAGGQWYNTSVKYARNKKQFNQIVTASPFNLSPFLVQEKIQGPGVGVFLLCKEGTDLARFAHRRIREKPPSGGVSVVCQSIEPPEDALDAALRLFRHANYTGVAMAEFKIDERDNKAKLIEVNARFWGSLELAISAGVDFPALLVKQALGQKFAANPSYRRSIRCRWELGDLDHLLIRLKTPKDKLALTANAPSRLKTALDFFADFFRPDIKNEIFRFDDPKPFLFELREYLKEIVND